MRRTTICRSSRQALVAVLALLVAAPLAAQQTTTAAAQTPGTHVVVTGETLWSIAQQYYSDPLLWPEIYRRNTAVIEDPHWIYPGEVLDISGLAQAPIDTTVTGEQAIAVADTTQAADTIAAETTAVLPPPPPPAETGGAETIFDHPPTKQQQVADVLRAYTHQTYRPVRRGEFYSSGFLTEGERLPWAKVLGSTATPAIQTLEATSTAGLYEEIAIVPPPQASYHVGDSLLIGHINREIVDWGGVVMPDGVARVTKVDSHQVLAQVIMEFARIREGRLALPLEPFKDPGETRPTDVENGLEGHLIGMRDEHVLTGSQQILFIDRGRADGVSMGDLFEAFRPASEAAGSSEESRVQLLIVHTREHSASALVIGVTNPAISPGMPVRLIKKMPS
jgi:LysM repeat protein